MRKFILITAMVLASAAAEGGESRSLTLSSDSSATAAPAKPVATPAMAEAPQPSDAAPVAETPKPVETPKYVDRPAPVPPKTEQPPVQQSTAVPEKPVTQKAASTYKSEKRRHGRYWTEGRIISELHRHGIYW
jgi:hypothetical protein